ncbi:transposase [Peribacillus butanolivorans]|uniref:transposase n=1 Tax=Peribacillus butanolivorans TaxID=421767 RepID=UPI0036BECDB7
MLNKSNSLIMVQLQRNGKSKKALSEEYDLTPSSLDRWIHQDEKSGSFQGKDSRSLEQEELLMLRKELEQQQMVNDIKK